MKQDYRWTMHRLPHKVTSNIRFGVQGADMDPK